MKYCVLDLETTTKTVHGRIANPFYNRIIAIGTKHYEGIEDGFSQPISRYIRDEGGIQDIIKVILRNVDVIVGHNLKFDLLYLWEIHTLQDWLVAGGVIWDTQLAEYYLTNQQTKFASLRELAVKVYTCEERDKLMEPYWEKGIDTYDIPKELVCKDVMNDVTDTEKIYIKQLIKANTLGMMKIIEHKMEALLATTEMEYNGLMADRIKMEENKAKLEDKLNTLDIELQRLVEPFWKL